MLEDLNLFYLMTFREILTSNSVTHIWSHQWGLGLRKVFLIVRYHDEGSKKLNAHNLLLSHMVYL
jgi:hypothetical protein